MSRNPCQARQQAGIQKKSACPGPVRAPLLVQQWLQSLSASDMVWIPGSGLWICLCFHDNTVLCKPCLLAGGYIWIHPCNLTFGFNLSWWLKPRFTPGFQLHSTLPSFHATHAHIQTPASDPAYRPPPPRQFQHWATGHVFHVRRWRSSGFPVDLRKGIYSH